MRSWWAWNGFCDGFQIGGFMDSTATNKGAGTSEFQLNAVVSLLGALATYKDITVDPIVAILIGTFCITYTIGRVVIKKAQIEKGVPNAPKA